MKILTKIEARIYPLTATQNDDFRASDPVVEVSKLGAFRLDNFDGEYTIAQLEALRDGLTHALSFCLNEINRQRYNVKDMHP